MSRIPASVPMTALVALLCCGGAAAQADPLSDPPGRVGRLSYTEGTVSFHAADDGDWSQAAVNYPITSGDAFWTEPDARGEMQIGGTELRMDHATEVDIDQLDDDGTRIDVPQGVVNFHLSVVPPGGGIHVMTPAGQVDLVQPGTYHIDSGHPDGDRPSHQAQVTALEGQVNVQSERSMLEVMPGETAVIRNDPPGFSLQEGDATPFDNWALAREKREVELQSVRYVSLRMTGYQDLDRYGRWSDDPAYGAVWYPAAIDPDWAPYRDGHWIFVQPWGWTWVDNAPWGFAPFHYGRWVQNGPRWGWVPGTIVERPVYAPALVAFVGGAGWSISLSLGDATPAVGWVPLGPREVFHPYYPVSVGYARRVNITNVDKTVINNITVNNIREVNVTNYVNRQSATVVSAGAFTRGASVHAAQMSVTPEQLSKAPVSAGLEHLQPTATARRGGNALPAAEKAAMPHPAVLPGTGKEPNMPVMPDRARTPEPKAEAGTPAPENAVPPGPKIIHVPAADHADADHAAADRADAVRAETGHDPRPAGEEAHAAPAPQTFAAKGQPAAGNAPEAAPAKEFAADRPPVHAPGPPIHRPAPVVTAAPAHPEAHAMPQPLPRAELPHPAQATHITPTPQGWQRTAAPASAHAEPPHDAHPAPGPESREKRENP